MYVCLLACLFLGTHYIVLLSGTHRALSASPSLLLGLKSCMDNHTLLYIPLICSFLYFLCSPFHPFICFPLPLVGSWVSMAGPPNFLTFSFLFSIFCVSLSGRGSLLLCFIHSSNLKVFFLIP